MRKLMLFLCAAVLVQAQGTAQRVIRAVGQATVSVKPDHAEVVIGVVTQAETAQEASVQNMQRTEAVLAQLRAVLGANADIKTIGYSVTPNYRYPREGGPPTLVGYTVSNTVEVATNDLLLVGRLIDAATQAGANTIGALRFTINDPAPVRARALSQAAKQARGQADAIATGLGVRTGAVFAAQEGVSVRPLELDVRAAPAASGQTPIETGMVEVQATVTVDFEIVP